MHPDHVDVLPVQPGQQQRQGDQPPALDDQLRRPGATVTGVDVNERALAMTRLNAALNGVRIDVRAGSLFEPVAGERFDLIVAMDTMNIDDLIQTGDNGWGVVNVLAVKAPKS